MLDEVGYVPTLAVRASEMNGLEYLPGATKDRMTPCFLLAPWVNARSLDRAIDRIERAFRNRLYFLDIDRDYQIGNLESAPQSELANLMNPIDAFANWVEFAAKFQLSMPCLQTSNQERREIQAQIENIRGHGQFYCVRIVRERYPNNIDEIVAALNATGGADYCVILEGGWSRDPLTLAAWYQGSIAGNLSELDADIPIVVSCTSMPKLFTEYSGVTEVPFQNRALVEQIRRVTNRANLIYGDWGSTRPREERMFMRRPIERVDYPTRESWWISRNGDSGWSFKRAAQEIVANANIWEHDVNVWGEELIRLTAINQELGINTPQKNVAARVNIHLHVQSFYNEDNVGEISFDDRWED